MELKDIELVLKDFLCVFFIITSFSKVLCFGDQHIYRHLQCVHTWYAYGIVV